MDLQHAGKLVEELEAALAAATALLERLRAAWATSAPSKGNAVLLRAAAAATAATGISHAELTGPSRQQDHLVARQLAALLASEGGRSLGEIGRFLSRDHTTVLHLIRRAKERRQADPEYLAVYRQARSQFDTSAPALQTRRTMVPPAIEPPSLPTLPPAAVAQPPADPPKAAMAPAPAPRKKLPAHHRPKPVIAPAPSRGPTLGERLLLLANKGPFTLGEAIAELQANPNVLTVTLLRLVKAGRLVHAGAKGARRYRLAMDRARADEEIQRHLAEKGVTRCPTAYAAPVAGASDTPGRLRHYEPDSGSWKRGAHKAARSRQAAGSGAPVADPRACKVNPFAAIETEEQRQ